MSATSSVAKVQGVASLRTEAALPAGATFEATLEDVSRVDAPAEVVGKIELPVSSLPIHFEIPFDPSVVAPERTYSVRARIFVNGRLAWTSDQVHRVLTRGAGYSVEMTLKEVPRREPSGHDKSDGDAAMPAHGLRLPATFRGDLPCADCEGVRHHLDLWPDQVFHLRREWLGKDQVRGEVGRWRVDPARRALILEGGGEMPLQFEIKGPARLRQLDLMGKPIASELPYDLVSDGQLRPADISLFMAGEVTHLTDSLRFTECLTVKLSGRPGQRGATSRAGVRREEARTGRSALREPRGSIKQPPGIEQGRVEPTVTVERFVAAWPNQSSLAIEGRRAAGQYLLEDRAAAGRGDDRRRRSPRAAHRPEADCGRVELCGHRGVQPARGRVRGVRNDAVVQRRGIDADGLSATPGGHGAATAADA